MQARNTRVAAHAQDLSESNLDPPQNKQLTLWDDVVEDRQEETRPEAGRSLGWSRDIALLMLMFVVSF